MLLKSDNTDYHQSLQKLPTSLYELRRTRRLSRLIETDFDDLGKMLIFFAVFGMMGIG